VNLKKTLEWLSGFTQLEIIVVEQDTKPKLHAYTLKGFKHIFTKTDLPMNKGWAYNVGVKNSTTNTLIFGDHVTRMEPNKLINCLRQLQSNEVVSATSEILELTQPEFELGFDMLEAINRDNKKKHFTEGILVSRKDTHNRIGGWPEEFLSQNGIDEFHSKKILEMTSHTQSNNKCFRFPSPKTNTDKFIEKRDVNLLENLMGMKKQDLPKYVNNTSPRIGLKMRFADK